MWLQGRSIRLTGFERQILQLLASVLDGAALDGAVLDGAVLDGAVPVREEESERLRAIATEVSSSQNSERLMTSSFKGEEPRISRCVSSSVQRWLPCM